MTDEQWALFAVEVGATFRGEFDRDHEAAMLEHFGRVPYDAARLAVRRLVRAGQVFVPTPGELVTALRDVCVSSTEADALLEGLTLEQYAARMLERRRPRELGSGA